MPVNVPALAAQGLDMVAHQYISVTQRTSTWSTTTGLPTSAAPTVVSGVLATVTPARGNDLLRVPEGRRNEEWIRIITRQALTSGDRLAGREADRVDWNGRTYEVEHTQRWDGTFYDALAVRVGE
jgi:hypothetical protein